MYNAIHSLPQTPKRPQTAPREEYVTIIAGNMADVMRQFRARGLDALGYAIVGRVGRHQFALADTEGATEMFEGRPMLAATFMRKVDEPAAQAH